MIIFSSLKHINKTQCAEAYQTEMHRFTGNDADQSILTGLYCEFPHGRVPQTSEEAVKIYLWRSSNRLKKRTCDMIQTYLSKIIS